MRRYTIHTTKIKKSCLEGFEVGEAGTLELNGNVNVHRVFFRHLDGGEKGCEWGRLQVETSLSSESILSVFAAASDEKETGDFLSSKEVQSSRKIEFFKDYGIGPIVNQKHILLRGIKGRYLWLGMEVRNVVEGSVGRIRVYNPEDDFLHTFPEVYQEKGSIFHRYLSIFSTVYQDLSEDIDEIGRFFDVQAAPGELLPVLGEWLGLSCSTELLAPAKLRQLLQNVYRLNRMKGTKIAIQQVTEIIMGENPVIMDKDNGTVVVMLKTDFSAETELLLLYFLLQFKPIRCKLHIISLQDVMGMDEYCSLDVNAELWKAQTGWLDGDNSFEQCMMN